MITFAVVALFSLASQLPALDPAMLEAQARRLETELIAPCCWSQQVSVHYSPASEAVRKEIRTALAAGRSPAEIRDSYVARYGIRILAEPPGRGFPLLLHWWPVGTALVSLALLVLFVRRVSGHSRVVMGTSASPTDADAEARLDAELDRLD